MRSRARSPAFCVRDSSPFLSFGLEPRAVAENECTVGQWRAPGRRLFDRIRRSKYTKHHSHPNTQEAKKRGRYLAPATARKSHR